MQDVVLVIDREGVYRKIAQHPGLLVKSPWNCLAKTCGCFPVGTSGKPDPVCAAGVGDQTNRTIEYELMVNDRAPVPAAISAMNSENTLWWRATSLNKSEWRLS